MAQIRLDSRGGLVALFGCFRQQLHHDCRERRGNIGAPQMRGHGRACDVTVDPLHGLDGGEWQCPHQHLVKNDSKRIQIATRVDRAIHSSGLFRRNVGERARKYFG